MRIVSPDWERMQAEHPFLASAGSPRVRSHSLRTIRLASWIGGVALAGLQAWIFRYQISADSISYLDMSDGVMPGFSFHRLINGVWSPLYPAVLGVWRRLLGVSPSNEIAYGHLLNVLLFIFAFVCFEFLLRSWFMWSLDIAPGRVEDRALVPIPQWTILILAYSLFLWASISEISLEKLRPDMLMSGLLYLAVGILLRMKQQPFRWKHHVALGLVLGIAFLAKAAMLPIGLVILACVVVVENGRLRAIKMVAASAAIMLLISSLYFVPLSRARGKFTMGESGSFNYLVHVDGARPQRYLQDPGSGRGSFLHTPQIIFRSPRTYAFPMSEVVTHPLRFDPSDWTQGVRPHFDLRRQLRAIEQTLPDFRAILLPLCAFPFLVLILAYCASSKSKIAAALLRNWPLWLVGLAGCAMYAVVHVEPRYVGAFFLLFWFGIFAGFRLPRRSSRAMAYLLAMTALFPICVLTVKHFRADIGLARRPNVEAEAAADLQRLGLHPGDRVGFISAGIQDLALERITRVEIIAEVDRLLTAEFWSATPATQEQLLETMVSYGVTAVVASPPESAPPRAPWMRLGDTRYWVWFRQEHGGR
jgi:hypothetical protein